MVHSWVGPTRRDRGASPSHVGPTCRVLAAHSEVVQCEGPLEPTLRAGAGARREWPGSALSGVTHCGGRVANEQTIVPGQRAL